MKTESFERACTKWRAPLLRHAKAILHNDEDAEDVVADVFLSVSRHWHNLPEEGENGFCFKAHLYLRLKSRIGAHIGKRQRRAKYATVCPLEGVTTAGENWELHEADLRADEQARQAVLRDEERRADTLRLYRLMACSGLTEKQREVLCGMLQDKSFSDIGRDRETSRQAVHCSYVRAIAQMRAVAELSALLEVQNLPLETLRCHAKAVRLLAGAADLTPKQRTVLDGVLEGLSFADIARGMVSRWNKPPKRGAARIMYLRALEALRATATPLRCDRLADLSPEGLFSIGATVTTYHH